MAMSPGSRQRGEQSQDQTPDAPLNPMQEPLGSMDRPIPRTSDDNDVNLASNGVGRRAGNLGRTGTAAERGRGFTSTFAIVAAILVAAFLVALYLGSSRFNDTQPPVADTTPGNAPSGDTTGSTTPAVPPAGDGAGNTGTGDTGTGNTGTGTGTTPPATP
jgi:hypothetical protein